MPARTPPHNVHPPSVRSVIYLQSGYPQITVFEGQLGTPAPLNFTVSKAPGRPLQLMIGRAAKDPWLPVTPAEAVTYAPVQGRRIQLLLELFDGDPQYGARWTVEWVPAKNDTFVNSLPHISTNDPSDANRLAALMVFIGVVCTGDPEDTAFGIDARVALFLGRQTVPEADLATFAERLVAVGRAA
jgi:hypothetical protein